MIKIRIISPGKIKDRWLEDALLEYLKRLSALVVFDLIWTKDEKAFVKLLEAEKKVICLDLKGQEMDSPEFAAFFFKMAESCGSKLSFAIGGPNGFPKGFVQEKNLISLSKMTFTHQIARLLLIEQIFRSFEIRRGSDYHR